MNSYEPQYISGRYYDKRCRSSNFRRPFLFVEPNSRLLKTATFLAIGPQIYVDGLIVIDKGRGKEEPVGN